MPPQSQYDPGLAAFGGGSAATILHPVVLAGLIVVIALTFLLPRKYVISPLLLGMLVIPTGQNLNVGAHFYVYRILILAGWARLCMTKPKSGKLFTGGFTKLDKVFLVWAVYRFLAMNLQFLQAGEMVYQTSLLADSLGGYFLFRSLMRDDEDVRRLVRTFVVVALVSAVVMVRELETGQNVLGLLGGTRLLTDVRNGRIRAQGVFAHPILAGSVGATFFPLFLWLWNRGTDRLMAIVGTISSSIMVFACASSTSVVAWTGTYVAVCLWPLRNKMRVVRWAIVLALLGLALVMKAPIWYILARVDLAGGSSGWERALLLDTFTRHLGDWWLIGTHANANWGWDMWDQANQFVSEGESGGLVAFCCFIAMFVICFKTVGNARKLIEGNRRQEWLFWLLGTAMFAQVLAYMGVDYFDHSKFVWYALLAIYPAATTVPQGDVASKLAQWPLPDPVQSATCPEAGLDHEVSILINSDSTAASSWMSDDLWPLRPNS